MKNDWTTVRSHLHLHMMVISAQLTAAEPIRDGSCSQTLLCGEERTAGNGSMERCNSGLHESFPPPSQYRSVTPCSLPRRQAHIRGPSSTWLFHRGPFYLQAVLEKGYFPLSSGGRASSHDIRLRSRAGWDGEAEV
jgi:hypothetical protein